MPGALWPDNGFIAPGPFVSVFRYGSAFAYPLRLSFAFALRERQLGDLPDGVAVGFETEPRGFRHREIAARRLRQSAIDLLVQFDREVVVLDQRAVRDARLEMHVVESPRAAVGY